jgi:hypothetical protein
MVGPQRPSSDFFDRCVNDQDCPYSGHEAKQSGELRSNVRSVAISDGRSIARKQ